jgi:hypothetical protein
MFWRAIFTPTENPQANNINPAVKAQPNLNRAYKAKVAAPAWLKAMM